MKRKIIFTTLWTLAFPLAYGLASMLMFAAIGLLGILKEPPPDGKLSTGMHAVAIGGTIWACLWTASPVIGLVLSIRGALPATKRKETPPAAV